MSDEMREKGVEERKVYEPAERVAAHDPDDDGAEVEGHRFAAGPAERTAVNVTERKTT